MDKRLKLTIAAVVIAILILLVILYRTHKPKDAVEAAPKPVEAIPKLVVSSSLQAPSDVKLEVIGTTIKVSWSDVPQANGYTAYYSDTPDFKKEDARVIENIDKGDFEINKVPLGKYYFRIASKATKTSGVLDLRKSTVESGLSELYTVEVTECTPIEPPKNVHSETIQRDNNSIKVLISWQPEMSSDGYVIRLNHTSPPKGDDKDYVVVKVKNVDAGSHLFEGLEASIKWYATVACNGSHCGEGLRSEVITLN